MKVSALTFLGRPSVVGETLVKYAKDAGFVDVQIKTLKQPFGPWPKDKRLKQLGAMMMLNCQTAFHAYGLAALTRILGMNVEEADALCRGGIQATRNKNSHTYLKL
jgi:hypothetical protein